MPVGLCRGYRQITKCLEPGKPQHFHLQTHTNTHTHTHTHTVSREVAIIILHSACVIGICGTAEKLYMLKMALRPSNTAKWVWLYTMSFFVNVLLLFFKEHQITIQRVLTD